MPEAVTTHVVTIIAGAAIPGPLEWDGIDVIIEHAATGSRNEGIQVIGVIAVKDNGQAGSVTSALGIVIVVTPGYWREWSVEDGWSFGKDFHRRVNYMTRAVQNVLPHERESLDQPHVQRLDRDRSMTSVDRQTTLQDPDFLHDQLLQPPDVCPLFRVKIDVLGIEKCILIFGNATVDCSFNHSLQPHGEGRDQFPRFCHVRLYQALQFTVHVFHGLARMFQRGEFRHAFVKNFGPSQDARQFGSRRQGGSLDPQGLELVLRIRWSLMDRSIKNKCPDIIRQVVGQDLVRHISSFEFGTRFGDWFDGTDLKELTL